MSLKSQEKKVSLIGIKWVSSLVGILSGCDELVKRKSHSGCPVTHLLSHVWPGFVFSALTWERLLQKSLIWVKFYHQFFLKLTTASGCSMTSSSSVICKQTSCQSVMWSAVALNFLMSSAVADEILKKYAHWKQQHDLTLILFREVSKSMMEGDRRAFVYSCVSPRSSPPMVCDVVSHRTLAIRIQ